MSENALYAHYPELAGCLPRLRLTELPTPLETARNLGPRISLDGLLIKRDDLTAPGYGGNKVRKLEYLLGVARARDCDAVVTFGAVGSNHVLATAIYARQLGMRCIAVLTNQPVTDAVHRTLQYHEWLGTRLEHARSYQDSLDIADRLAAEHPTGAERLYRIPWGGSSPLGAVGFVQGALELVDQCNGRLPDVIYSACGTMGTVAGLGLGLQLAGASTRIEAIRVVPEPVTTDFGIDKLFSAANQLLHDCDDHIPLFTDAAKNVTLRGEFYGDGYAEPTPACLDAVELIGATEQLRCESTYTGKALAALIHDARDGRLDGQRVVFWNTYNSRPYPPEVAARTGETLPDWVRPYLRQTG